MPSFLFFAVTWAGMAPEQALERALDAAEPPPAMRAAFHATLTAGSAVRRIEYDPYARGREVQDHASPPAAMTNSTPSLRAGRERGRPTAACLPTIFAPASPRPASRERLESMAVSFRHRMSANDGPVDQEFSANMVGRLQLDSRTGYLTEYRVQYRPAGEAR